MQMNQCICKVCISSFHLVAKSYSAKATVNVKCDDMTCCTFTGVFGIVLTTRWTESVTKEMAEVKSAKTTPAMIETQSLAPYLAVVVKMWMTKWMV